MLRISRASASAVCAVVSVSLLNAQFGRGGGDWTTIGNDAQRSFWLRFDGKISPDTMSKPGFQLVWKFKMNNAARQLDAITPPALLDFYIGYRGFRTLGFFGGSSDKVITLDTDLSRLEWEKSLAPAGATTAAASSIPCPGGMTTSVTRPTSSAYPAAGGGRGRGNPAKSGVGKPFEGAVTIRPASTPPPQSFGPPPGAPQAKSAGPTRRITQPANPFARTPQYVYAVPSDGKLHAMYVSNGEEPNPAVDFIPANARTKGLIVFDGFAYVATTNGCSGVENGIWSIDMDSKKVSSWKAPADIAGSTGLAASPDGAIYVASGGELFSLENGSLTQKASYKADGATFTSSPIVFEFKGKNLVAASTSDGKLHVVDGANMSAVAKSDVFSGADFDSGALASWQDASGTRWILAPASANGDIKTGAIVAFKLTEQGALERAWASRDLTSPLTPSIVNGVIFAISSGEFRPKDAKVPAATRALRSSKAVLYALDAVSGKELWNSGTAITSFVHSGGLAAGGGRVYVSAHDGTQYAFSFPMEH